jgi:nucleotide-binding universal stress UspA family protein
MLTEQGCTARGVCVDGAIAESVLYAASVYKASLIILTRHGRGHSAAWPIGRNVERVIKSAQCPLLLI